MTTPPHHISLYLALLLASHPAWTQPLERMRVTSVKPLLKGAIERGQAYGLLIGEGADLMRSKFDAHAPIEIDVRTLQALHEPGCRRLEVSTRQANVLEKAARRDQTLTYQINYCQDGRMPTSR